ncbi:MAG: hypothetical protein WC375_08555, partial [Methanomassiliicoccales archaeon]
MSNPIMPEDREPLNTKNMLEEAFLSNLKTGGMNVSVPSKQEALYEESSISSRQINTEDMLKSMYEVHDDLVMSFGFAAINHGLLNTALAKRLTTSINKVDSCIRHLGGTIEKFNLIDHVSGLQVPNIIKNAERVIDTTKQCYTIGKVESAVHNNSGEIAIVFGGIDGNVAYKASGTITSPNWSGNEAIDYIYTPGSGKMSV